MREAKERQRHALRDGEGLGQREPAAGPLSALSDRCVSPSPDYSEEKRDEQKGEGPVEEEVTVGGQGRIERRKLEASRSTAVHHLRSSLSSSAQLRSRSSLAREQGRCVPAPASGCSGLLRRPATSTSLCLSSFISHSHETARAMSRGRSSAWPVRVPEPRLRPPLRHRLTISSAVPCQPQELTPSGRARRSPNIACHGEAVGPQLQAARASCSVHLARRIPSSP